MTRSGARVFVFAVCLVLSCTTPRNGAIIAFFKLCAEALISLLVDDGSRKIEAYCDTSDFASPALEDTYKSFGLAAASRFLSCADLVSLQLLYGEKTIVLAVIVAI